MKKTKKKPKRAVEVKLGRALAEGGEGRIHELPGRPGFVAKVYHQPPTAEKIRKLEAMVAVSSKALVEVAAWPTELLRACPGGPPIGVVMPHVENHRDIHLLYGPRSRLAAFPLAGWPFLIRTAANLARAFAVVHANGHVVGDVNDRVALVSDRAVVRLIDCDGFQVRHGTTTHTCDVGVLTHQPPELQGISTFRGLRRSAHHDGFGLAVLIFQLLFMARHPFSGSYGKDGDMPLERAIKEYRFVYGKDAAERGMRPPPASLDLSVVTRDVARLFERAFSSSGARTKRPSAKEWVTALDELGRLVQRCRTNPSHAYLKGRSCPFCAIDRQTDMALFHQPLLSPSGTARAIPVHLPTLWKEIASIEPPEAAEALPSPLRAFANECDAAARGRTGRWAWRAACAGTSLLLAVPTGGLSLALLLLLPTVVPCRRTPGGTVLANRARDLVRRWNEKASERLFLVRRTELERARSELAGLDEEHARGLLELDGKRKQHQLDAYLRKQRVADAALAALDKGTKAVLESFGIETAHEISEASLSKVRLSEPARRALLGWRKRFEARFSYDPGQRVDPSVREALERATRKRRADLVQRLVDGPARLRNCVRQIGVARKAIGREIKPLLDEIERARDAA